MDNEILDESGLRVGGASIEMTVTVGMVSGRPTIMGDDGDVAFSREEWPVIRATMDATLNIDADGWCTDLLAAPEGENVNVSVDLEGGQQIVTTAQRRLNGWSPLNGDMIYAWRPLLEPAALPTPAPIEKANAT